MMTLPLRHVHDDDADALLALVGGIYAEYPGCVLEPDGQDSDLRTLASAYAAKGGEFWVIQTDTEIVACVGWAPLADGVVELKRLYVGQPARRKGLGGRLVALVEDAASRHGARVVELWSDTRFADAHRLYETLGYVRQPDTRELHDASNSVEYHYRKQL
jgi:putative acetyltransferase